jgi:peptide chain release factor 1
MYEKVCSKKKWQLEIINISKSEAGGFKGSNFFCEWKDIYSYLKYESGVHRVQRIPETETQGRVPHFCSYSSSTYQKLRMLIFK